MPYAMLETRLRELPEPYIAEVYDFVDFLISRKAAAAVPERRVGAFRGKIRMAPDFDETPEGFEEYMP